MRLTRLLGGSLGAAALFAASAGHTQEMTRDDLTSMLPCEGSCAVTTRPESISLPGPEYPVRANIYEIRPEAVVEIIFTVLPDGSVSEEVEVARTLGPAVFVESVKAALRRWKYKPATLDGQPVASTSMVRGVFSVGSRLGGGDRPVRGAVSSAYDAAMKLMNEGKLDEAKGRLSTPLALPLNFFERGLLLHLLALIAVQQQDFFEAQRHSGTAMLFVPDSMTPAMWRNLRRINLLSQLNLGNIVGAVHVLDRWKKEKDFDASDPLVAEVEAVRKKVEAPAAFAAKGRIPPADEADGFEIGLYRRKFSFANVRGRLDRFILNCQQKQSRSPIAEGVEWGIPKNFSNCFVFIKGEPGTTFDIVQIKE